MPFSRQPPSHTDKRKPAVARSSGSKAQASEQPDSLQRALHEPAAASPREMLALQRKVGNRAVSRLAAAGAGRGARVQAKLTVGPAGDAYEQEADRVAGQVMRMAEPGAASAEGPAPAAAPENALQFSRADSSAGFEAGAQMEAQLSANKGAGAPLPDRVRSFMEPRFGADFGSVRVHTGPQAVHLNRDVQARAFTQGSDIYFGAGQYQPDTTAGNHLLAHELTHVVQQGHGGAADARRKFDADVARVQAHMPANRISTKRVKMHLDFVKIKRKDPDFGRMVKKLPIIKNLSKKKKKKKQKGTDKVQEGEGNQEDDTFAQQPPTQDEALGGDTWGHWWLEIGDLYPGHFNVQESYGWWPDGHIGNNPFKLFFGVPGALNSEGPESMHDEHEGHPAAQEFHPVKEVDPEKPYEDTREEVTNDIRNFAKGYHGVWNWVFGWGKNCHTFQEKLMKKAKLKKSQSEHWLKKPVLTEEEKEDKEDKEARAMGVFGYMTLPEDRGLGAYDENGNSLGQMRAGEKIGITGRTSNIQYKSGYKEPAGQYYGHGGLFWVGLLDFQRQTDRDYPLTVEELDAQEKGNEPEESLILDLSTIPGFTG